MSLNSRSRLAAILAAVSVPAAFSPTGGTAVFSPTAGVSQPQPQTEHFSAASAGTQRVAEKTAVPKVGEIKKVEKIRRYGSVWPKTPRSRNRPGWSVAEGKRRARKSRNRARHKRHVRG